MTSTYRIFTTTNANIATSDEAGAGMTGQCVINDQDCDDSNNAASWMPGKRIGFPTNQFTVTLQEEGELERHTLNVRVIGSGQVTRFPDKTQYLNGEQVTLTPVPARDSDRNATTYVENAVLSRFDSWGGDVAYCSTHPLYLALSTNKCGIVVDGDKEASAMFVPIEHVLTVDVPDVTGAVARPVEGAHNYNAGTVVSVRAGCNRATHSFGSWNGDCDVSYTGSTPVCTVYMDSAKTVSFELTVGGTGGTGGMGGTGGTGTTTPEEDEEEEEDYGGCEEGQEQDNGECVSPPTCTPDESAKDELSRTSTTTESRWVMSGNMEVEETKTISQPQSRTATWNCDDERWDYSEFEDDGAATETQWELTGNRRCKSPRPTKPQGSKTDYSNAYRWDVRGSTAIQPVQRTTHVYSRTVSWTDVPECAWDDPDFGQPDSSTPGPWTDTGTTLTKPDDYVLALPPLPAPDQDLYRWVMVFVSPSSCVEYQEKSAATKWITNRITYSWGGSSWVGTASSETRYTYAAFARTGQSRLCNLARSAEDNSYTLSAGRYELEWDAQRIAFTVPVGANVKLTWREQADGAFVAVLKLKKAELLIASDTLSGDDETRSARFAETTEPTLSLIADSLSDPRSEAPEPRESSTSDCAVVEPAVNSESSLDLGVLRCVIVRHGGQVTVSLGVASYTFSLSAERDWLIVDGSGSEAANTPAATFVDLATGSFITLLLSDGTQLSRNIRAERNLLSPLFDAMRTTPPTSSEEGG